MSIVIVFFSSYRFLGRQRIGSVKVQAKLKCNARGYYETAEVGRVREEKGRKKIREEKESEESRCMCAKK